MNRLFAIALTFALAPSAFAQSATAKADKRLADLLSPSSGAAPAAFTAKPAVFATPKALDLVVLPIIPYAGPPARLPAPASLNVKPGSVPEGTPLASYREPAKAPKDVELPTQPLIRLPSIDAQTPVAIPILAKPNRDRAPLTDPAFEASVDVALKQITPGRTQPVPFMPFNLPDPFENVRFGQLRNPPEESPTPPLIPLTKPK
jgi:hypothetical protein